MAIDEQGSLTTDDVIRHFSRRAFVELAGDLGRCFVCGAASTERAFNDEHVIPDWVLRRFGLHSQRITLPNGTQIAYGRYKLRCCVGCNTLLGEVIETPISRVLSGSLDDMKENLEDSGILLYQWLCLLFIKLHLKDRELRADRDLRRASEQIGDWYDWDGLHHIHSVARSPQSSAWIDDAVPGTTLVFPMRPTVVPYDFQSLSDYSTICVRIGPLGIVGVLNDCGGVGPLMTNFLSGIEGPLSDIQLREIAARVAFGNTLLTRRPKFWSELHPDQSLKICALPPLSHGPLPTYNHADVGAILVAACEPLLRRSQTADVDGILERLARNEVGFVYNEEKFIKD